MVSGANKASRQSIHALEKTPTSDLMEGFGAAWLRLLALVRSEEVQLAQWTSGNTPVRAEDAGVRSKGLVSDPTPTIAGDGRRMLLRARVLEAEGALVAAAQAMARAEDRLARALDRHQSDETAEERAESTAATRLYGGVDGEVRELWDHGSGTGGPSDG